MVTIKELKNSIPDRVLDVYTEGQTTVVIIPNGRVKIMDEHRLENVYDIIPKELFD